MKSDSIVPMLRKIKKTYSENNSPRPNYLDGHLDQSYGDIIIQDIIPSPEISEYRNKCEFTFGKNINGKLVCINYYYLY